MTNRSRNLEEFARALERAAGVYLAARGVSATDVYRLTVADCPVHGPGCAVVTYGMLRDHVVFPRVGEAEQLAVRLLATLLPPESANGG